MILTLASTLLLALPARSELSETRVTQELRAFVAATASVELDQVEILFSGLDASLPCPADSPLRFEIGPGERFAGHTTVRLEAGPLSDPCSRARLRSRIRLWTWATVAASDTTPGQELQIERARVPLDQVRGRPLDPGVDGQGPFLSKVSLRKGEPVTAASVRPMPAARRGEEVIVVGERGALTVRASGRLLEDALIGQRVPVLNLSTGQVQRGRLADDGFLYLDLDPGPEAARPLSAEDGT